MKIALLLALPSSVLATTWRAEDLSINGLLAPAAATSPFVGTGDFLVAWSAAPAPVADGLACAGILGGLAADGSCAMLPPAAFEVQVADESSAFPASSSAATTTASSAVSWSSGRVTANATTFHLPAALTGRFSEGATYKWRVALLGDSLPSSDAAAAPAWAPAHSFDVAPAASAWSSSRWIGGGSEVRAAWSLPAGKGGVVRARAYASGLGSFKLNINGQDVGDHFMDPGEAVYDLRALYVGFNVTQLLSAGSGEG